MLSDMLWGPVQERGFPSSEINLRMIKTLVKLASKISDFDKKTVGGLRRKNHRRYEV